MLDTGTEIVESELNTEEIDDTVFETELRELEISASQVVTTLSESSEAAAEGMSAIFTHQQASVPVFPTFASTKVASTLLEGITLDNDFVALALVASALC